MLSILIVIRDIYLVFKHAMKNEIFVIRIITSGNVRTNFSPYYL